jgi:pyruvate/2-oxoglutarate dehydrogenase complex dihydrolipoamide dehydrogenase (E3) component
MKNSLGRKDVKELVKTIVSARDQRVIGFHMAGSEASEIMQACAHAWVLASMQGAGQCVCPLFPCMPST